MRAILSSIPPQNEPGLIAKSPTRMFWKPDAGGAWKTRLLFDDGSAETRRFGLERVRMCLQDALSENHGVIEIYDLDAFSELAGPLMKLVQLPGTDSVAG